jgi:hypothetical protein
MSSAAVFVLACTFLANVQAHIEEAEVMPHWAFKVCPEAEQTYTSLAACKRAARQQSSRVKGAAELTCKERIYYLLDPASNQRAVSSHGKMEQCEAAAYRFIKGGGDINAWCADYIPGITKPDE